MFGKSDSRLILNYAHKMGANPNYRTLPTLKLGEVEPKRQSKYAAGNVPETRNRVENQGGILALLMISLHQKRSKVQFQE